MSVKDAVSKKISAMVKEGYRQPVAVAATLNMKRRGRLSETGAYRRTHRERRGPVGKMRRI